VGAVLLGVFFVPVFFVVVRRIFKAKTARHKKHYDSEITDQPDSP
jgi:hypothetical protein